MTNICFFCGDVSESGGTEKVLSIITNELAKNKEYNITILSRNYLEGKTFFDFSPNIKIESLRRKNNCFSIIRAINDVFLLRKFIKNNNIDIIVDVDLVLDIFTIPALFCLKAKLVSWEHFNFEIESESRRRRIAMKLASIFSNTIITLTKKDMETYKTNFKKIKRIEYISNPLEKFIELKHNVSSKQIISVGKLLPIKGYDLLLEVAEKVLFKHADWKWVILGDGPEYEHIYTEIKNRNLDGRLILKGKTQNVDDYYNSSSIFVLTSKNEGFGIVILEAKAHGLPIVCFDIKTGVGDMVIDDYNGYIIKKYDTNHMSEKIIRLIENKDLRENFSSNAYQGLDEYKIENIIQKWNDIFTELR